MFWYLAYTAVRTVDQVTHDLITYCWLIIWEALMHGGQSWLKYERSFHAQEAINISLHRIGLIPNFQAAPMLGQQARGGIFCFLCQGINHPSIQWVLGPLQQPVVSYKPVSSGSGSSVNKITNVLSIQDSNPSVHTGMEVVVLIHICNECITFGQWHQARKCKGTLQYSLYKHVGYNLWHRQPQRHRQDVNFII